MKRSIIARITAGTIAILALALMFAPLVPGVSVSAAGSRSIGVNFTANTWYLLPADQPGAAPGSNWNNINGGSGNSIALTDNTASATTALLSFNSAYSEFGVNGYAGFTGTSTPNAATNRMYQGGLFGDDVSREITITLTNVPYSTYDVYVYASADTSDTHTLSMTNGAKTYYYSSDGGTDLDAMSLLQTLSTDSNNPTAGPGQYQVFRMSGPSVTLTTGGSLNSVLSNNVFGVQIVEVQSAPANKDQCKNDGWKSFTSPRAFKNQGDCIQFVNTGK